MSKTRVLKRFFKLESKFRLQLGSTKQKDDSESNHQATLHIKRGIHQAIALPVGYDMAQPSND